MMDRIKAAYDEYASRLFAAAFHLTGKREDAEDVVQETFIRLSRNIDKIEGDPKNWLYKTAVNLSYDFLRKLKTRLKASTRIFSDARDSTAGDESSIGIDAAVILDGMDEKTRQIFVLRFIEGMEFYEISEITGIPVGTLKSTVSRTSARLREKIK